MKIRSGYVSNSSTSSFICDTDMSVGEVREKLQKMLNGHNEMTGDNLIFNEIFAEPFVADNSYCKDNGWADYYAAVREAKGKIIIEGIGDNSVPYEMWEYIIRAFDAERCHFG